MHEEVYTKAVPKKLYCIFFFPHLNLYYAWSSPVPPPPSKAKLTPTPSHSDVA